MRQHRLALVVALLAFTPSAGHGQGVVNVKVRIEVPILINRHGLMKMARAEDDAQKAIMTALKHDYPYWDFKASDQDVNLAIVVKEPRTQVNTIVVFADAQTTARPAARTWEAVWLKPGDQQAHGFPPPENVGDEVAAVFSEQILKSNGPAIGTWLKENIAVASSGSWHAAPDLKFNIIFPIRFDPGSGLRSAIFKVDGQSDSAARPNQFLRVNGTRRAAKYHPGNGPEYDGVLGLAVKRLVEGESSWDRITPAMASELRALTLGRVLLLEEGGSDLDVDVNPADQ